MPDIEKTPRQGNLFEYANRAVAAPAKPSAVQIADCRRMLYAAQIMAMNPRYTPREQGLLANLEGHLRWRIRRMQGRC
jgi:hypothetical protein